MNSCVEVQDVLGMLEEWTLEQEEIAEQERLYYKRKKEVLSRMQEANRQYAVRQEAETAARQLWHLAQTDWHLWRRDMPVAVAVIQDGEQTIKWQTMCQEEAVQVERKYKIMSYIFIGDKFQYMVRPALKFCDGVTRVFFVNPNIRSTGNWETV